MAEFIWCVAVNVGAVFMFLAGLVLVIAPGVCWMNYCLERWGDSGLLSGFLGLALNVSIAIGVLFCLFEPEGARIWDESTYKETSEITLEATP